MSRRAGESYKTYLEVLKTIVEVGTLAKELGAGAIIGSAAGFLVNVLPIGLPIWAAIIFGILIFLIIAFAALALRAATLLAKYRSAERHFLTVARLNVGADLQLFRQLFLRIIEIIKTHNFTKIELDEMSSAIDEAIKVTNTNIEDVLTQARVIMEEYSGYDCAACIKLYSKPGHVKTVARDAQSKAHRVVGEDQPIMGNTALIDTLLLEKNSFGSDNMIKMGGTYENTRKNWKSTYNSSLVIPIESPYNTESRLGCICIDSLRGKLYNTVCEHYTRELASRLGVMVYRLGELQERLRDFRARIN